MSGGTPTHNRLAADAPVTLSVRLRAAGSGCNAVGSGQRVRVEGADPVLLPGRDRVPCADPTFDAADCVRDPVLIVEVLSPSTADYDRGEKFAHYRRFPPLRHYCWSRRTRSTSSITASSEPASCNPRRRLR